MKTFVQKKSDPTSDRLQLLTVVGCETVACVSGADWKETIVKFDDGSQIGYCRLCGGDSYFSDDDLLPERLVGTRGPGTFVALHKREHFDRHYHVVAVHCDAPPLGQ